MRIVKTSSIVALCAAFALSACGKGSDQTELAKLDNEIIANQADPALTSALEDQILVDPALTQQSNRTAVRSPAAPAQAQYPLPSPPDKAQSPSQSAAASASQPSGAGQVSSGGAVQMASAEAASAEGSDCASRLNYDRAWASRLPPAFAVYPGARLTEAAGHDGPGCRARVVTFTTAAPPQRVLDHYRGRAASAGFSAEQQRRDGDHILAGTAGGTDAAYYLILTPLRGGGSDVAMITNGG